MGGCQNCGPFLGTLNIRCRNIVRAQKGTLILTTTHAGSLRRGIYMSVHGPFRDLAILQGAMALSVVSLPADVAAA